MSQDWKPLHKTENLLKLTSKTGKESSLLLGYRDFMDFNIKTQKRTSLVVQWLGICLPLQRTLVQSLVQEDSTCREATKPMCQDYWACALELMLHNKRSHCKKKSTHRNESSLPCCNYRKSASSNEDPALPKLKLKKKGKAAKESWASWNVNNKKLKVQIHCLCSLLSLSRTHGFLSYASFCETAPFSLCFLCLTISYVGSKQLS